jgi:hypothetical protein
MGQNDGGTDDGVWRGDGKERKGRMIEGRKDGRTEGYGRMIRGRMMARRIRVCGGATETEGRMIEGRKDGRIWQNDGGQNDGGTDDGCVAGRRKGMAE